MDNASDLIVAGLAPVASDSGQWFDCLLNSDAIGRLDFVPAM